MKTKKLLLTGFIALMMCTASLSAQTWQAGVNVTATLSGGVLTVSGTGAMASYNINGQQLFSQKATSETETVSVDNLPSGVYLLKTSTGQTMKWIKN